MEKILERTFLKMLILATLFALTQALQCANSKVPIHTPHKELCSKFYSCYKNKVQELQCPPGFFFETNELTCREINQVYCGDRVEDENKIIDEYALTVCANKTNSNEPNPQNCASFYMCTNGTAVLQPCPANLYFNVKINQCDWYYNVDCCEQTKEH